MRFFSPFPPVSSLSLLPIVFLPETYVQDTGAELVNNPSGDEEMIPSLLQFKSRLDSLLTQSFSSNPLFAQTLRESFEHFINRRRDKPAEYIAKYLDNLLRKGDKGLTTDATLEEEMDRALMLFRYCSRFPYSDNFIPWFLTILGVRMYFVFSFYNEVFRVLILRFVHGKDVFEAFYKKDLAKRLLLGKSASTDAERSMLAKLKNGK